MAKVDSTAHSREIVFVDPAIGDRAGVPFRPSLRHRSDPAVSGRARHPTDCTGVEISGGCRRRSHRRPRAPGRGELRRGAAVARDPRGPAVELAAIGEAVAEDGRLLLWACNSGEGARGEEFIAALAAAIGAPVFAAKGKVGAAALGGSWELDVPRSGSAAQPPLTAAGIAAYAAVMATPTTTAARTPSTAPDQPAGAPTLRPPAIPSAFPRAPSVRPTRSTAAAAPTPST